MQKTKTLKTIKEEELSDKEMSSLMGSRKRPLKKFGSFTSDSQSLEVMKEEDAVFETDYKIDNKTPEELKEELKKWLMKKYKIKTLNGLKIFLEDLIQLMMLLSCVYKDNILSPVFLAAIVFYMSRRKVQTLVRVAFIIGLSMLIHYFLALSNLHSSNSPMKFPVPFDPYPDTD